MTRQQPGLALDRLAAALEAEILAAPDPEIHGLVHPTTARPRLDALRAFVADAVERAEERGPFPPETESGLPGLRRP